jgi:hypothetical protein
MPNLDSPDLLDDAWECPTCLQPFHPHHDYECGTCETKASEHLRVTTLCRLLRETQRRESSLIVARDKLTTERNAWRAEAMEQSQLVAKLINNLQSTECTRLNP